MARCACPDCRAEYNCPGELPLERSHALLLQRLYDQESAALGLLEFASEFMASKYPMHHMLFEALLRAKRYWQGYVAAAQGSIELLLAEQQRASLE